MNQNSESTRCKSKLINSVILVLTVALVLSQISLANAQADMDNDGILDSKETELASKFSPTLQFKAGEHFFPVDIGYHLSNSVLKMRSGETVTVVDSTPTVTSIASMDESHFLANTLGNFESIYADYEEYRASLGYTVYGQVKPDGQYTVVQYWFFYAYNDAPINEHEGDWEVIMILLDNAENPVSAVYSQHLQGQRAAWSDVEKVDDTHPRIYVARGSHANYYRPYQGKLGLESDDVGSDGFSLAHSDLNLVMLGEIASGMHPASQDWLTYAGRWGNWGQLADAVAGFAGPYGPGQGDNSEKWYSPTAWGESVNSVNANWFNVSWIAANFLLIFIVLTAVFSIYKVWRIIKLKRSTGLRLPALIKTRASIGIILGIAAIILTIGGMLLPWYVVSADVQTTALSTQGAAEILVMDGQRGVAVNFLVGGRGMSPIFSLGIPIGILLLIGVVFGVLDIVGVSKAKSLGNKYLRGGIFFLILFIILVLMIVQLTSLVESLATAFGITLPPEAVQMAQAIAQQPLQGTRTSTISEFGSVQLSWGLGLGAYMILGAAVMKLIGGIILRTFDKSIEAQAEQTKSSSETQKT